MLACKWELGKVDVISEGGYNVSHARAEEVETPHIDMSFCDYGNSLNSG